VDLHWIKGDEMGGNSWDDIMAQFAAMQPSASGWDGGQTVTMNGQDYVRAYNTQTGSDGSIASLPGAEYVSAGTGDWYKGKTGTVYDAQGNATSQFEVEDPNAQDPMELLILAALAAGGGATMLGLGGGGLGLGNSALGSLGGLGGVAEAGTAAGMIGGSGAATAAGGLSGLTSTMGGSQGLSGLSAVDLTATGLPLDAAGSVVGAQAGGGVMSNAAINSMISGAGLGTAGAGGIGSTLTSLLGSPKTLAGLATTALGAASGAGGGGGAGGSGGGSGFAQMDPRLDPYVFGSLLPNANATMQSAIPQAQQQAGQMATTGGGLLSQPMAGNGYGQVKLNAPTTATNPYISGVLDDLQRRSNDMIGKNLQGIRGNSVGVGGLGGSRQGVAEAQAISQGTDNFTGQAANFMGGLYNQDQNRALQQYGQDQQFYGQQRGQDYLGANLGMNMLNQSQNQLWQPMQAASDIYRPYTALPSASGGSDSSSKWQGIAGGLLSGASLAGKMGLWG
jgi:hypothetical protein